MKNSDQLATVRHQPGARWTGLPADLERIKWTITYHLLDWRHFPTNAWRKSDEGGAAW